MRTQEKETGTQRGKKSVSFSYYYYLLLKAHKSIQGHLIGNILILQGQQLSLLQFMTEATSGSVTADLGDLASHSLTQNSCPDSATFYFKACSTATTHNWIF